MTIAADLPVADLRIAAPTTNVLSVADVLRVRRARASRLIATSRLTVNRLTANLLPTGLPTVDRPSVDDLPAAIDLREAGRPVTGLLAANRRSEDRPPVVPSMAHPIGADLRIVLLTGLRVHHVLAANPLGIVRRAEARSAGDLLLVEDRLLEADRLAADLLQEEGHREVVRPVENRAAQDRRDKVSRNVNNKTPSVQGGVSFVSGNSIRRDAQVRSFQLRLQLCERDGLRDVVVEAGL